MDLVGLYKKEHGLKRDNKPAFNKKVKKRRRKDKFNKRQVKINQKVARRRDRGK